MRRTLAQMGVGLALLAMPALAATPPDVPDHARAQALDRLRAQLTVERTQAQALGHHIAAAPMWRHVRAARQE